MTAYFLSKAAEQDLREIAAYTKRKWGVNQLNKYRRELKKRVEELALNEVHHKQYSANLPYVYVNKVGAHFIFYHALNDEPPMIIGVIHEARDIVSHLTARGFVS